MGDELTVHLVAEVITMFTCGLAWEGERGTEDRSRVTCQHCLAGTYPDGTPVSEDALLAGRRARGEQE